MSQNERKTTEIRASKVGNSSPCSCPGLDARVHDFAARVASAGRPPRCLLLGGRVGSGAPWLASRLASALNARGCRVLRLTTRDFEVGDGALDAKACAAAIAEDSAAGNGSGPPPIVLVEGPHALGPGLASALKAANVQDARSILAKPGAHVHVDDLDKLSDDVLRECAFLAAAARDARRPVIGSDALAAFANLDKRDDTLLSAYEAKASVVLHTALPCDASVLKPYVVPALKAVCPDAPEYVKAQALLHHLAPFDVILKDALPAHAHVAALLSEAK